MWKSKQEFSKASAINCSKSSEENVEDCGCSTSSMETVKSIIKPTNDASANITEEENSEIYDSGILSGLQTNTTDSCECDESTLEEKKLNTTSIPYESRPLFVRENDRNNKEQNLEANVFDSGCIDDDIIAEEKLTNNDVMQNQNNTKTDFNNERLTHTARNTVHTAVVDAIDATGSKITSEKSQMLLKQNVEAGMLEWFCNLSIQENANSFGSSTGVKGNDLNVTKKSVLQQHERVNVSTDSILESVSIPFTNWQKLYNQDDDGNTPLHLACYWGDGDVVAALIRRTPHPCLISILNDAAQTPLHIAAQSQHPIIMRMLLLAGAMPNIRDNSGNTALHLACKMENIQCVQALTAPITPSEMNEFEQHYGIHCRNCSRLPPDLEIRNYDGENCVHLAAQTGNINILRILVLSGADINVREGKAGYTCLHMAIQNSNEALGNFLMIECGEKLNLEIPTYARLTAYQLAKLLNRVQLIKMLEQHGAELLSPPESDSDYSDSDMEPDEELLTNRFGDPGYFVNLQKSSNIMPVA